MLALYLHFLPFSLPLVRFGGRDEIISFIEFTVELQLTFTIEITVESSSVTLPRVLANAEYVSHTERGTLSEHFFISTEVLSP